MAKRLSAMPAVQTPTAPNPTQFVTVRAKGLQIVSSLQPSSFEKITSIDTQEGYLQVDAKLAQIRNGKAQWKLALKPISEPMELTIKRQKEALAAAKAAAKGVEQLDAEVSDAFDRLEAHAKFLLGDFKQREMRLLREAEEAKAAEAEELRRQAAVRAAQAAGARTPQLKARLEQQRADLEAQAEVVETQPTPLSPIKGAASVSRVQKKVRIVDPIAFLRAVVDYQPTMGVYRTGVPPLECTDKKGAVALLVEIVGARLNDLYREQPGVVTSWPGVEEFDDITIAGK